MTDADDRFGDRRGSRQESPPPRPLLHELTVGDPPDAWADAGFTVDTDGTCQVGQVRLVLAGDGAGRGIRSWSFRRPRGAADAGAPADADLDGLPTRWPDAARAPVDGERPGPAWPGHTNGVEVVDHVVVLTPDPDRSTAAFQRCGFDVRRVRPTSHAGRAQRQTFFRSGEVVIEVVGPEREAAGTAASTDAQAATAARPASFYGLAFAVTDLGTLARLLGARLSEPRPAVQAGRRIATLRHRDVGISVPVAFLSTRPVEAPTRSEASSP